MKLKKRRRAIRLKFISSTKETKNEKIASSAFAAALSALIFGSLCGIFINLFSVPILWYLPVLAGVAAIAVFYAAQPLSIKQKAMICGACSVAVILICVVFFKFLREGYYILVNRMTTVWNIQSLKITAVYQTEVTEASFDACTALYLLPSAIALALLCAYIVKSANRVFTAIVIAAAAVFISLIAGETGVWAAMLYFSVMLLICRSIICANDTNGSGTIIGVVCAVLMLACAVGMLVITLIPADFTASLEKSLQRTEKSLSSAVHKQRFETETYGIMPEGDFFNIAEEVSFEYEDTLQVTMADEPQSVYIRGYVGEVYTDLGWRPLEKSVAGNYSNLFYQLYKNGFYPQTQLSNIADILDDDLSKDDVIEVNIKNKGACREFIYAPYEVHSISQSFMPQDRILTTGFYCDGFKGQTDYKYQIFPNQVGRAHELEKLLEEQSAAPSKDLKKYLAMEAKYRSFVYENYTAISEEDSALLEKYIGKGATAGETHIPYKDAKSNILLVLGRQLEYEENMKPYTGDTGFLQYVLRGEQCGNAPHYATVTTMMLRHYGIPARYVEGYLITPDDADSADEGEIELTDFNAHAWAEYYHDGLGWIPFETNPLFIGVMEGVSAPPQGMQQSSGGGGGEEEPPDRDRDKDKDDELDPEEVAEMIFPWVLLLAIFSVIVYVWLNLRNKKLRNRKNAFESADTNSAVCAMMLYMRELLAYCGITDKVDSAEGLIFEVSEKWGSELAADFANAVVVFMKASFGTGVVAISERDMVHSVVHQILKKADSVQNKQGIFVAKYIKFLY